MAINKDCTKNELAKKYEECFKEMYEICEAAGFGDPFSYARSREILMAVHLEHEIANDYSGADAYNKDNLPVEYKSTISKKISATYNGVSVQPTWEEQERYLREEKIGKYPEHYFARFEDGQIVEVFRASGDDVLKTLLPKFERQYNSSSNRKDPRLGATLSEREINQIATRIIY